MDGCTCYNQTAKAPILPNIPPRHHIGNSTPRLAALADEGAEVIPSPEAMAPPTPPVVVVVEIDEDLDDVEPGVLLAEPDTFDKDSVVPGYAEPEIVVPEMTIADPPGRSVDPGPSTKAVSGPEAAVMMVGWMVVTLPPIVITRGETAKPGPLVAFGAEITVPGIVVPPTTEAGMVIGAPPAVRVVPGPSTNAVTEPEP